MADTRTQAEEPRHPAPHRRRVAGWRNYAGLILAPGAWSAYMLFAFGMADLGCGVIVGVTIWTSLAGVVSLLTGLYGGYIAHTVWKRTRHEAEGDPAAAIDVGEGRARFFGMVGMIASGIFAAASLIVLAASVMMPPC
jgi:hypothetical protein